MSTTRRSTPSWPPQANRELEGAPALEIMTLGVRGVRLRPGGHLLDGRHGDDPPRRAGRPGHRRDLPRHRLPLRGDHRHPRRGRARAQRQRDQRDAGADRRRAGRRPGARTCSPATPTSAARCARSPRWTRPCGRTRPGPAGCAGPTRKARAKTPVVSWDAKRQADQGRPDRDLDRRRRDADYVELNGLMINPLLEDGLRLDRLRALHRQARPAATPGPAAGPAWPRPNAGSTCERRRPQLDEQRPTTQQTTTARPPGATLWFTGLPSAGKSTIAHALADRLAADGPPGPGARRRRGPAAPVGRARLHPRGPRHQRPPDRLGRPAARLARRRSCWSR